MSSHTPPPSFLQIPALTLAAAVAAGALAGCARPSAQPAPPPPPKVTVAEVAHRPITEWDELTGRLEAVDTVAVRPRVSGYVSAVRFTEGAVVRRGDLLFQIDPRPFQAEVDRLGAERRRADAVSDRARTELQRAERLRAEDAMSTEEFDRRAAFVRETAAETAAIDAALDAADLDLEFTRVTAPIGGRVGRAIVTEGNLVSAGPGEATLLTTIVSIDPIHAHFDVDESIFLKYVDLAREGRRDNARTTTQPIRMALADDDGYPLEGRLDFLDNRLDPGTGTIRGRAIFRNPKGELTPGLFVRLRLPSGRAHPGVLIQDRAVGTDLDKRFVFVVTPDKTIEYRPVTLGPLADGLRIVRDGLAPGERIVVSGLQRVQPGMTVDPEVVAMEATGAAGQVAARRQEEGRP